MVRGRWQAGQVLQAAPAGPQRIAHGIGQPRRLRFVDQVNAGALDQTPLAVLLRYGRVPIRVVPRLYDRPVVTWGFSINCCLLYTSDAADEEDSVDLGGR